VKHEYHEGPKPGENFVNLATAVFQAKKDICTGKVGSEGEAEGA
jgi:hypothetical protein